MKKLALPTKNMLAYAPTRAKNARLTAWILIFGGMFVGAVNGLFGAGGGMLAVPLLCYVAKLPAKRAHATAIAFILPLAIVSAVFYVVGGIEDKSILLPTISGVVVGGVVGAMMLKGSNGVALNFVFYALMFFAGLKMML